MTVVVDTNLVVRLLTADDPAQFESSRALFSDMDTVIVLLDTVLLEAAWVLGSAYGLGSTQIAEAFEHLARLPNVTAEGEERLGRAIELVRAGLDIADAFHVAALEAYEEATFVTFDRALVRAARIVNLPVREP